MGTTIRRRNKKGIAIFMVLFIMVVLGALMVQFHQNSRQAQNTVHRFQTSEMARQLAAAGQEEAFDYLHKETGDIYDASFNPRSIPKQIIEKDSSIVMTSIGPDGRKSVKGIELQIPVTKALAGDKMEITATARISDSRNTDFSGNVFYGNESIGTIEIVVTAKAKDQYKKQLPGSCTIVRQHDYKVVSIATNKNREAGYSGSSFLDYVLFVRNGQQEFLDQQGGSFNPKDTSLEINAESGSALGKVNLGASGNFYHYLNISNNTKELLPNAGETLALGLEAADYEVDKFYPAFTKQVKETIKKGVKEQTDDVKIKSLEITGHKAIFYYKRLPITDEAVSGDKELSEARENATKIGINQGKNLPNSNDDLHYFEGIKIKPVEKYNEILGSDIRKQFLNYGFFKLDLSNCYASGKYEVKQGILGKDVKDFGPESLAKANSEPVPCYNYKDLSDNTSSSEVNFKELYSFISGQGEEKISNAFISIKDEYAYTNKDETNISNHESFYKPSPSGASTPETNPAYAHYPYSHFNLFNKRYVDNLERFGIYGIDRESNSLCLHLRGIVHSQDPITLGEANQELLVDGYGVIIAPSIRIEGAIKKKDPNNICVLFARDGNIIVNTNKEIQAALICSKGPDNKESSIVSNEQLNLVGCLVTDRLNLSQWKHSVTHKITYDSALSPSKDIYQININKRITFERILENE